MRQISKTMYFLSMAVLLTMESAFLPSARAEDTPPVARLSVRGEAQFEKPADQVEISIGVTTNAPEATTALRQNSEQMDEVVKQIQKVGLTLEECQTGRFRVRPMYDPRPRGARAEWKPQIIGYECVNTLEIKTRKLDLIGKIIEQASKAGANTIDSISFSLANPRQYRGEAIQKATLNAISDARVLARTANVNLVRILSMNLDHTPIMLPRGLNMRGRAMTMEAGAAPPIAPGKITIRASVSIVYEISQVLKPE